MYIQENNNENANQRSGEFSQVALNKSPTSQFANVSVSGHEVNQSKQLLQNMSVNPSRNQLKQDATLASENSHLNLGGLSVGLEHKDSTTNFRYGKQRPVAAQNDLLGRILSKSPSVMFIEDANEIQYTET